MNKPKALFFAEGATLAHIARPLLLAKELDPSKFDVTLCRPDGFSKLTEKLPFPVLNLDCQDAKIFAKKLAHGTPLYDFQTLCRYVNADLALIDQIKPDVVVGDFRISLSVSARLRSTRYIAICDAYWSPERPLNPPLPVLSLTRYLPISFADYVFRRIAPFAFRVHANALERLRKKFHMPSLGHDLRRCYTDADLRLFANFPALFPEVNRHEGADFIGPIAWSPDFDGDLGFLAENGHLTYITMGSSGNPRVIDNVVPILKAFGSRVIISRAGMPRSSAKIPPGCHEFDFLPGSIVCRHADLVICNGGSPTTNQALTCGVPVLGIVQNMDQFLNMEAIVKYGAGLMIRADQASNAILNNCIRLLMRNPEFACKAKKLSETSEVQIGAPILAKHILNQYQKYNHSAT